MGVAGQEIIFPKKDKDKTGLFLIGKVSKTIINDYLSKYDKPKDNQGWFFCSYNSSGIEYKLNHIFDTYKPYVYPTDAWKNPDFNMGDYAKEPVFDTKIKIIGIDICYDTKPITEVPHGYKTLLKLEFEGDKKSFMKHLMTEHDFIGRGKKIFIYDRL